MTLRNLITDIPGLRVGHAGDAKLGSGTTAIVFDAAVVASVDVRGGGPGTRETALLDPAQTVEGIDAIVLSGGSAFGLDAASGVQAWLREQGRGFQVREARVADRAGRDPVRSAHGRRQELGPLSALSRARLRGGEKRGRRFRARQRRRRARRHHRQPQGRHRLGLGADARRADGRRHRGGERRRQRHRRRRPAFLGGAVRAEQGIRRARLAAIVFPPMRWRCAAKAGRARTRRWRWSRPTPSCPRRKPNVWR